MNIRVFVLVLSSFGFCAVAQAAVPPSAQEVARALDRGDARSVVTGYERDDRFGALLDRIAIGDEGLIRLAPRLAPGTDAASSEGLRIALAKALPRAPALVLDAAMRAARDAQGAVVSTPIDVQAVCSVPFIEPSQSFVADYRIAATRALAGVRDPRLVDAANACAKRIASVAGPSTPASAPAAGGSFDALVNAARSRCPEVNVVDIAPAALLDMEDGFRDRLEPDARARLDEALPRTPNGGIAQCNGRNGAACDARAYVDAIGTAGLLDAFARRLCEPGVVR
ncbi:hypothetical protein BH09PSE6_BH09PSE6_29990 [soil metagenome]